MNPEAMRALRRIAIMVPRRLDIQLADSSVTIVYGGDPQAYALPFGKEVKRDLAGDLELKAEAKWEKERVVVTRSVNGGGSMTESFIPTADGKQLTVVVAVARGRGEPMEFRRVYDRARPGTP